MGLLPVLIKSSFLDHSVALPEHVWLGNGIVLISMIFFCLGWIFFKKLIHTGEHNIQLLNGVAMIIGGITSTAFALLLHGKELFFISFSDNFMPLLVLFVFASLLTYTLYAYLLEHFSPTFISFAGFLEPAFAMLYGMLFFGYTLQVVDLIGFLILFAGLYIFYRQEL
jgi:drug/metabolite transporter (DMT)-like permease